MQEPNYITPSSLLESPSSVPSSSGIGAATPGAGLRSTSNLRPYYNPGSFESPLKLQQPTIPSYNNTTIISTSGNDPHSLLGNRTTESFGGGGSGRGPSGFRLNGLSTASGSTASGRIITEEYDYLDIGSTGDTITELLRSMLRLYGKIFISQPWRVGRLVSQVGDWSDLVPPQTLVDVEREIGNSVEHPAEYSDGGSDIELIEEEDDDLYRPQRQHNQYAYRSSSSLSFRSDNHSRRSIVPEEDTLDPTEEELDDEMSYFTSSGNDMSARKIRNRSKPNKHKGHSSSISSSRHHPKTKRPNIVRSNTETSAAALDLYAKFEAYTNRIHPPSLDTIDIVFAIYYEGGLRGMWRAVNTSFILDAFEVTIEAWLCGFYSSLSGVPDPHFIDIAYSPVPGTSLATAVAAAVTTAVILAPISVIRTRLMTTTLNSGPRSLRTSLKQLESWLCPPELVFPTALFAGVTSFARKSSGYILQVILGVDRVAMPTLYSILTFAGSLIEISIKLPLETIVRRAHMAYLTGSNSYTPLTPSPSSQALAPSKLQPADLIVRPEPYEGVFGTFWSIANGKTGVKSLYRGWWWCIIGAISDLSLETVAEAEYGDGRKERF